MVLIKDCNILCCDGMQFNDLVVVNVKIFVGSLVCFDVLGNVVLGVLLIIIVVCGIVQEQVDNIGGVVGVKCIEICWGVFQFVNSVLVDQIICVDIGKECFIVDDQMVVKIFVIDICLVVGVVCDVDDGGVWVEI